MNIEEFTSLEVGMKIANIKNKEFKIMAKRNKDKFLYGRYGHFCGFIHKDNCRDFMIKM